MSTAPAATLHVVAVKGQATVQDWPGRVGYWSVGVPPSGAMDDLSFRLGNAALGNPEGIAGIELLLGGLGVVTSHDAVVCVCGARVTVLLDGAEAPMWAPVALAAGARLDLGQIRGPGMRTYLLVGGGIDVARYLGSAATFTLGRFGGHEGRPLRVGDSLAVGAAAGSRAPCPVPDGLRPHIDAVWSVAVTEGPHAAPEFFTAAGIDAFYAADWQVHHHSARTGVRLSGARPGWARSDGGDAGMHPSNIHDTPYSVGSVDFTGDTPVLLGPDGPSLGGFTCPAVVVTTDRWKLGQMRPGDTVRFRPVDVAGVPAVRAVRAAGLRAPAGHPAPALHVRRDPGGGILVRRPATPEAPAVTHRLSGDDNVLIEYGPMALDLALRLRVHALAQRLAAERHPGILDLTEGIRSLQVHTDPDTLPLARLRGLLLEAEVELPAARTMSVPSREVELPLSWDDPATREAVIRYMATVRADAPWCPWNIEFIRRVNGLETVDDVHRIVHEAEYLVLGLGDVYLGAPVATPLDPRHRLVTTKYNPARTWTPENAVGIGGAYLCIYGMEGPGGYQFIGRTVPVWRSHAQETPFESGVPWLLRAFDRIRWYPVSAAELLDMRARMTAGRLDLRITEGRFALADHEAMLARNAAGIRRFAGRQRAAFDAELAAWSRDGELGSPSCEPVVVRGRPVPAVRE